MKYTHTVIIDRPRDEVVRLFTDPDTRPTWQPGLVRIDPVSGTPGQEGAVSNLIYTVNYRESELQETVIRNNLPDEFTVEYRTRAVRNVHCNRFSEESPNQTRYEVESDYRFRWMMLVLNLFLRGAIRRQTRNDMQRFKDFVEGSTDDG